MNRFRLTASGRVPEFGSGWDFLRFGSGRVGKLDPTTRPTRQDMAPYHSSLPTFYQTLYHTSYHISYQNRKKNSTDKIYTFLNIELDIINIIIKLSLNKH